VEHVTFLEAPQLQQPPLIAAFRGWNDGGEAATVALRYLVEHWQARPLATLDPDEFYDFQVNRPTVRLDEGVSRVIEWPKAEFASARVGSKDVVLFTAPEPNNRWRSFCNEVLGVARAVGSPLLVTMGAFLTDVPHSRDVPVVGSAADEATADRLGLSRSRYEGPTGITGVLHDLANRSGLPSVSVWAAVPHYLPPAPNPKAALALVERLTDLLDLPVQTAPLRRAATGWEEGVQRLVAESEELSEYLRRLEEATDQPESEEDDEVPSGEAIAAELERFLREQGEQPSG
jgi:predicted ATP-grasp superfamily ATP-dependent carboligase